ncbi:MAG TPA: hypothetical protein VFA20_10190, partial [Myxococcaceae bacterium]|nr:hypothetical protein [Myxococcaceae bacterium]
MEEIMMVLGKRSIMRRALGLLLAAQSACTPGLRGQCQIIREPGPALTLPRGFAQVDGMLVQRAGRMASAVQDLRGPLARSFRIYFEDETLPLLCGRLEHARQLAVEGQARNAGRIYQALFLSSQVFELAIAVHAFSEYADRIGVPSGRIMAMQEVFVQQVGPLLAAALNEDPDGIAAALAEHGPEYAAWVGSLDRWASRVGGQTERLKVAKLVWDIGTLVVATYDAATAAADLAVAGRPPSPPLPMLISAGTAAAGINGSASVELAEVIRELIAVGALDAPVVVGLSQLGGPGPTT